MTNPDAVRPGFICPLCGRENHCAVGAGEDPSGCWCMTAKFPPGLLELVPAPARRRSCICRQCLEAYRRFGPAFLGITRESEETEGGGYGRE
ncbi:MAG: hypothetical protein K0R57_3082 [Paenibacillaceae bacterium]|jgi:hypothetical protein|nr:hypothetical protein [Paenibacillaceae bacterium]